MPKANKPASQKPDTDKTQATEAKKPTSKPTAQAVPSSPPPVATTTLKPKSASAQRSRVGGTAVEGAKSVQPKEITSTDPQKQQAESYNREMRRRMQHMKTGPYSDAPNGAQQRKKKLERRKQRIEEKRQEFRKTGIGKTTLGRRNTIFLITVAILLAVVIVFAILNNFKIL